MGIKLTVPMSASLLSWTAVPGLWAWDTGPGSQSPEIPVKRNIYSFNMHVIPISNLSPIADRVFVMLA